MAIRMTEKQAQRFAGARKTGKGPSGRSSKYRAVRTTVDGFTFDSKKEAAEYQALLLRGRLGEISNLELQPKFPLHAPNGTLLGCYIGDFRYRDHADKSHGFWTDVCSDAKGVRTALYRWKIRHAKAEYPDVLFREV